MALIPKKLFKVFIFIILILFILAVFKLNLIPNKPTLALENQATIIFQPTSEYIMNPERGIITYKDFDPSVNFSNLRDNGYTLSKTYVRLDNYRSRELPDTDDEPFLSNLNTTFQHIRNSKTKIIIRFTYNKDSSGIDTTKEWIFIHLDQLKPILQANADVILGMEAGFIGAWGEWHSSTNDLDTDPQARADILYKILDTLPQDRMTLLRYVSYKYGVFGQMMEEYQAFTGSDIARVGFHNDCFLSNDNDRGTYGGRGYDGTTEYWQSWVAHEGQYVPVGGTTCEVYDRFNCDNAKFELNKYHWTYFSTSYYTPAIQVLKDQGCWDEIVRKLGYRFVLDNLNVSSQVSPGGSMNFQLTLHNEGYAAMYNQRPVYLVFENKGSGYKETIPLASQSNPRTTDPRWWQPAPYDPEHQEIVINEIMIDETITVPPTLPTGTYNLYLWLPDAYQSLRNIPEYAVRMANSNIWQASTGYNLLYNNLEVTGTPVPPSPSPSCAGVADLNCDGSVNQEDLKQLLNLWGIINPSSKEDINSDSMVNSWDMGFVFRDWD